MQEPKKYLYMKQWGDYKIAIIFHLGAYYIARLMEKGSKEMIYTIRRYKTLSGAERYMKEKLKAPEGITASEAVFYETEVYIKSGSYWKL